MNNMQEKKKSKKNKVITDHGVYYREQDTRLPPAIIVDIDGTIALMKGRSPFDSTKWEEDVPHQPIVDLIAAVVIGYRTWFGDEPELIFMTGREGGDDNLQRTYDWIEDKTGLGGSSSTGTLLMREPGDHRGDTIVKRELFKANVEGQFNILWVFEDRNKMVNFWRNEMKLPTLQVKDGDY